VANEACRLVHRLRAEEHASVWHEKEDRDIHFEMNNPMMHPGMPFLMARDTIQETKTWEIVKKMPKGALLHCHFDGSVERKASLDRCY
jgi:adenosine deaminase CECR1